jgi:glycosyltransferase involved in cell wall biosynthesis
MTIVPTRVARIALCVTEDWFVLSHFVPLIRALRTLANEVVVITNDTGRIDDVIALGVRVVRFDYERKSTNPLAVAGTVRRLAAVLRDEQPNAVHLVALKPIVLGGLAVSHRRSVPLALHLTGLGLLALAPTRRAQIIRRLALSALGRGLDRPNAHLFIENTDDLAMVRQLVPTVGSRATVLGGAGVDPGYFAAMPAPVASRPRIAFAGRLIHSKGVAILVDAVRILRERGLKPDVHLYGRIDQDNPEVVARDVIAAWQTDQLVTWHGHTRDVRQIWQEAAIFVAPSLGGEGMPRTMLEAAACGRPLLVTDVPGCRHFVRDGIEGLLVPPGDATALADALQRLLSSEAMRLAMGQAARERVLDGYTELAVEAALIGAYRTLLPAND